MQGKFAVSEFALCLHNVLKRGEKAGWRTTMDDSKPNELDDALKKLEEHAGPAKSSHSWLTKRRKSYLAHHRADPSPWPPPVALDWLWVECSIVPASYPEIEAPAYAAPPGGEQRAS